MSVDGTGVSRQCIAGNSIMAPLSSRMTHIRPAQVITARDCLVKELGSRGLEHCFDQSLDNRSGYGVSSVLVEIMYLEISNFIEE